MAWCPKFSSTISWQGVLSTDGSSSQMAKSERFNPSSFQACVVKLFKNNSTFVLLHLASELLWFLLFGSNIFHVNVNEGPSIDESADRPHIGNWGNPSPRRGSKVKALVLCLQKGTGENLFLLWHFWCPLEHCFCLFNHFALEMWHSTN